MTTTLSIRIEEKTKKAAQKTLEAVGLDLSSAVKMFLHQVIIEQGIPFKSSRIPQNLQNEWKKLSELAMQQGKSIESIEELHKDFLKKFTTKHKK